METAYSWEEMLPLFISKLIFRSSVEEECIYENLIFFFPPIKHTFFQNMLLEISFIFMSWLCVHMGEGKKKRKNERMIVCEERERGVCSMGAYSRRHGITLTLTPKTGISLGKACFYILLCASAVKHVYISLVYLLYLCKYMCVTLVYRYINKYIRKHILVWILNPYLILKSVFCYLDRSHFKKK